MPAKDIVSEINYGIIFVHPEVYFYWLPTAKNVAFDVEPPTARFSRLLQIVKRILL